MGYEVVMTATAFIDTLKHIAFDLGTAYRNTFPLNLLYRLAINLYSADCWNLIKAVIWGFDENEAVGQFVRPNPATGLGDWNGWTILNCCSDISTDFANRIPGEFMLSYRKDHAGVYVGEFDRNGCIYNTIECTPSLNGGGVVPSYVSEDGSRYDHKDGRKQPTGWYWHGKLPWIDYQEERPREDVIVVDGSWGMATTRYTQKLLGTPVDGIVSNQPASNKRYLPAAYTGSWEFKWFGYRGGSDMVRAMQTRIGAEADGFFGRKSVMAMQTFLRERGDFAPGENDSSDGYMGADTVKAWQRYINWWFKQ